MKELNSLEFTECDWNDFVGNSLHRATFDEIKRQNDYISEFNQKLANMKDALNQKSGYVSQKHIIDSLVYKEQ